MNKFQSSACSLLISLSMLLLSCGGGGSSVAGIDGSGAPVTSASGTVNGFGSVIVNGVRYHSDKATITVDGQVASENSLHTGYQVRVTGTLNSDGTGTASSIEFTPNLVGAITAIDLQNEQLVLLQQTVQITNTTLFDSAIEPNDLSGLAVGAEILVSGQSNSEGMIAATRIELAPQKSHQLTGVISNLTSSSFTLNNLTVNFSAASLNNLPNNQLKDGLSVSIKGSLDSNGIFQASAISYQRTQFSSEVKNAEVEGFITRFVSASDFSVAGITCSAKNDTIYTNGTSSSLALGSSVKVEGTLNAAGTLIAQKLDIRQKTINEINGQVTAITSTSLTGPIATGTLQIAGTSIQTNNTTVYEDVSNERVRRFNFASIDVGNYLKVTGYTSQAVFIATKIERKILSSTNEFRYDGAVTQADASSHSFTVYGQTLYIDSQTQIRGNMGASLSEQQFFAQALNQQVRVKGSLKNGQLTASQIEIRQQDNDFFHRPQFDDNHERGPQGDEDHPENGGPESDRMGR
ncbi:MAG TPA: DUF5666 domain-containing protein [Cellvibrio sp.]|nr:DUF5666 domain-containing protein [Cellvibrio sp.]